MNNQWRCFICEMIIKIFKSGDDDSLEQLQMIEDYVKGMKDLLKEKKG